MKKGVFIFNLVLASTLLVAASNSNKNTLFTSIQKTDSLETAIEAPRFTFIANIVSPTRGQVRNLTSNYDLKVTKDTIIAYLPFFGRAYTAPLSSEEAGIMFTSTQFSYTKKQTKHGGWLITIKTKDTKSRFELYLSISKNGYTSLNVVSIDRESITFMGEIKQP